MIRRILIFLVLLGLVFIAYRFINPSGASGLLENIRELPGKIFSRDKDSVKIVEETTILHITTGENEE